MTPWSIGAFASLDAGFGVHLDVVHDLGIPTIQLHAPKRESRTAETAARFLQQLDSLDLKLTAVFGGFDGESYESIPIVEETVGLVPAATRDVRLSEMKEISDFAKLLKCPVVALHLGFVPHNTSTPEYQDIVAVTRQLCEHVRANGQDLHLETGQESAQALVQFIDDVGGDNLFVNFDPANMILYGTGEPIEALKLLGERVHSVHCKDALWSDQPGKSWGEEVPLGNGQVNVESYLETLNQIGYRGPLTIEREIPQEPARQKDEIGHAATLLRRLIPQVLGTAN